jgi:hypothetical protein
MYFSLLLSLSLLLFFSLLIVSLSISTQQQQTAKTQGRSLRSTGLAAAEDSEEGQNCAGGAGGANSKEKPIASIEDVDIALSDALVKQDLLRIVRDTHSRTSALKVSTLPPTSSARRGSAVPFSNAPSYYRTSDGVGSVPVNDGAQSNSRSSIIIPVSSEGSSSSASGTSISPLEPLSIMLTSDLTGFQIGNSSDPSQLTTQHRFFLGDWVSVASVRPFT